MKKFWWGMMALGLMILVSGPAFAADLDLNRGWSLHSGAMLKASGAEISQSGFDARGWYDTSVPATVLAALVANRVYPDPYFGRNLQTIPGVWPPPFDKSSTAMPPFSPFRALWWYRTDFEAPADFAGKRVWLTLHGVNYEADVWLNGALVAGRDTVRGMYRVFEFDVTDLVRPGENNGLAVAVRAPRKFDLAETWVDWNPAPPDRDMGLWRPVTISASGPAALRHPFVQTDLPLPATDSADLTVMVEVKNALDQPVQGTLRGAIGEIEFEKEVALAPRETKTVMVGPKDAPALHVENPRLWWPYQVSEPNLYDLDLVLDVDGEVSDRATMRFGIREIEAVRNDADFFIFRVNGKNILIRGGGWASDMMFRQDPHRLDAELAYVKQMNLNTLRLEAKIETDRFFERTDEEGILVMAGWCCCHQWERWGRWDAEDYEVAYGSERDQALRLRSHPSLLAWLNGSDNPPPAPVEKEYLRILQEAHWPNPSVSSANDEATSVSGPSGVKMTGPYEWVPPVYWYEDTSNGGAFGFNTETSPGPAVPEVESLEAMVGEDHLWPIDSVWKFHAGRGMFGNLDVFTKALEERYGKARDVYDYARKSQAMTYEGERAMFEAYGRNKYVSTGVIQWMLNDAWPSLIWHLYDYYLRPGGGFYGTRKACEPLHIQYSYDDRSVVVVNSRYQAAAGLTARAHIWNLDLTEKFRDEKSVDAGPDSAVRVMTLPEPEGLSSTYFVRLELIQDGAVVSENFYWLSTRPDQLNWPLTQWYYTPAREYADLRGLESLPPVELGVEAQSREGKTTVTVTNLSSALAFMVRLRVLQGPGGEEVLPILWSDNYFSLLPGESREVTADYDVADLAGAEPAVVASGWNVIPGGYR